MDLKKYTTRILGIILLIAAMLAHKYIGTAVIFMVIAGLVMLISNKSIALKAFRIFIKSFKQIPHKRYFLIALYDMLLIAIVFLILPLFSKLFVSKVQELTAANIGSLLLMLFAYLILITFVLLLAYSVFKGLIWLAILKQKPSAKYFQKFLLLNLCWLFIWCIPGIIVLWGLKPNYFIYVLVLAVIVYIHLTSILHYTFTKDRHIRNALKQAFATGIGQIKQFLLPYAYIILVYFVLLQVFWIVPRTTNFMLFASLLFIVFYLAWYRLYLAQVLKRIMQQ